MSHDFWVIFMRHVVKVRLICNFSDQLKIRLHDYLYLTVLLSCAHFQVWKLTVVHLSCQNMTLIDIVDIWVRGCRHWLTYKCVYNNNFLQQMQSQLKQTGKWLQSPRKYVLLNINFFISAETYIIWTYIFPWDRYAYTRTSMNLEILENPMWWTAVSGKPRLNRDKKVPWIELE